VDPLGERVALVTGGARGQGRSHAMALARRGVVVVVSDMETQIASVPYTMATRQDLDETVDSIRKMGGKAYAAPADMRDSRQVTDVIDGIVADHGRLDVLIANAGICSFSTVANLSDETWHDTIETNLSGVFYCIRAAVPHMTRAGYGRIVATSSGAGRSGMANLGHYSASKWGLIGLVKSVALETAKLGITVNVVCPTSVATPMILNDSTFRLFCPEIDQPTAEDARPRFEALNPMGVAWLEPEDVTRAVMYFVDDPGYTSGTVLEVNLASSASRQ
jgi:SDR family mycofactocin-dependent oxidoreductase